MTRETFYQRLEVCKPCPFWRNVCLKGHSLRGAAGCPIRKFPPINAADYARDKEVDLSSPQGNCKSCGKTPPEIAPMTWPEALAHLAASMKEWRSKGFPLCEGQAYASRTETCKKCPGHHYAWFQCRLCKCLVYTKAKLATETCPAGYW